MINQVTLKSFGPLTDLTWSKLGNINLIIGKNASGKTFLLKALYSAIRTLEEYKRGDDQRNIREILFEKLYWTFQTEKIGDIVSKGTSDRLELSISVDNKDFTYEFGKDTARVIPSVENHANERISNSVYLPSKEVLSIHHIILQSRDVDKVFGFDDTYYDLAKALRQPLKKGNFKTQIIDARKNLRENILDGVIEYDEGSAQWQFKKGNRKYSIGATAEGIKKIAILDTLLGNRYIENDSIVFIDEPESALHPTAISSLLELISLLAECGIQFFLASHSYFVVKKLYLLAQEHKMHIPVLSLGENLYQVEDLLEGMPENEIINESIRLYEQEVDLALR